MAGHSHWAGIKHRKAMVDNKRAKLWSRLSKAIIVAAKMGGGDPDANIRLRTAIADAKAVSLPRDNIERAIKKGTGEIAGGDVEEIIYEGYGPAGVAVMCDILTDNRNRTAAEIRKIFEFSGGKLGETNCVAYLFERKGILRVAAEKAEEERLMEIGVEAGAEDVQIAAAGFEIFCEPEVCSSVVEMLEAAEIEIDSKEITRIPSTTIDLGLPEARKVLDLMEKLDDHDDVQSISANFNIPDEAMAVLATEADG